MWSQTLCHEKIIEQLKKAKAQNKLAHAYLFQGIEGIGKKRVALGLAQMILCEKSMHAPCEICSHCKKIVKNCHPDCFIIVPEEKTIKIETIRSLKQMVYRHPLEANAKVVLLDEAEKMSESAANALLKILEEPPQDTYFILISHEPSLLLPTIHSRCQKMVFTPIPFETLSEKFLQEGFSEKEAKERSHLAQGSFKRGLRFDFEQHQKYLEVFQRLPQASPSQILEWSEQLNEEESLESFFESLSLHLHQQLLHTPLQTAGNKKVKAWELVEEAKHHLERYPNKQLLLENLLFQLTRL